MRLPFVSRRRHHAELAAAKSAADRLREERDDARTERAAFHTAARAGSRLFNQADAELGLWQEIVPSHMAAAGHPSTVLHDVHAFVDALEQALTDAGVDVRSHLDRMEGVEP